MPKGIRGFQKGKDNYSVKVGVWNKGKKWSKDIKEKISKNRKGITSWNKGKPAPWTSKRNKIDNCLRRGEKHWHWKGGIGTERHKEMARQEYKQWRSDVFKRDNWTCQTCQARGVYLEAHHIKPWAEYPELRYETSNGVTLCLPCHKLAFSKNK